MPSTLACTNSSMRHHWGNASCSRPWTKHCRTQRIPLALPIHTNNNSQWDINGGIRPHPPAVTASCPRSSHRHVLCWCTPLAPTSTSIENNPIQEKTPDQTHYCTMHLRQGIPLPAIVQHVLQPWTSLLDQRFQVPTFTALHLPLNPIHLHQCGSALTNIGIAR